MRKCIPENVVLPRRIAKFSSKTDFISQANPHSKMSQNEHFSNFLKFLSRNATISALKACLTFNLRAECKNGLNLGPKTSDKSKKVEAVFKM